MDKVILEKGTTDRVAALSAARAARGARDEPLADAAPARGARSRSAALFCVVVIDEREQAFRTLLNQAEPQRFGIT